jgi:hypothetical protein
MFQTLSLSVLLLIFAGAAAAIWVAGIQLSDTTDVLSMRLGLGEALGGLILLAIATNLPEIAITATAALANDLGIAIGNILGGIAIQTVVLAVLDAVGVRGRRPLTYQAASLALVLEGTLVIAVVVVAIGASRLPASLIVARVAPGGLLIAVLWVVGIWLLGKARTGLPWHEQGDAPDSQPEPRGVAMVMKEKTASEQGRSTTRTALVFAAAAGGQRHLRRQRLPAGAVPAGEPAVRPGRAAPGPGHRHLPDRAGRLADRCLPLWVDLPARQACAPHGGGLPGRALLVRHRPGRAVRHRRPDLARAGLDKQRVAPL